MALTQAAGHVSDDKLVVAARAGDRNAYSLLIERYRDLASSFAISHVHSKDEAEDAVQEAFVKAYLNLNSYRGTSGFSAWLLRIVRNCCIDSLRRTHRHPTETLDAALPIMEPGPEAQSLGRAEHDEVDAVLKMIPSKYRTVLIMHYPLSRSNKEIADVLEIPVSTVIGRISVGLKLVRKHLADRELLK
jgi:RNA polymerase sigma-70 factor (ECF subfamily)